MAGGRGLDHAVLAVHDLDAAAAAWEQLGFTLTPVARHPWGTANRLVQMQGSFLEILGVADPARIAEPDGNAFSFGAFNRNYLAGGAGMSMLALESRDADGDRAAYVAAGLPAFDRFDFERTAHQPDGSARRVAFSLAFTACKGAPRAGFFSCQQHVPENFWQPAFQTHANRAAALTATVAVAEAPARHRAFLTGYTGSADVRSVAGGLSVSLPRGRLDVLTPDAFTALYGSVPAGTGLRFGALEIAVEDVAAAVRLAGAVETRADRPVVPAERLHGTALAFVTA